MVKEGQIYRERDTPTWRKYDSPVFVITSADFTIHTVDSNGITDTVGYSWINSDCELIAEYPTWQEAVNSEEFKGKD